MGRAAFVAAWLLAMAPGCFLLRSPGSTVAVSPSPAADGLANAGKESETAKAESGVAVSIRGESPGGVDLLVRMTDLKASGSEGIELEVR